jgi:hypothetical protein
VISYNIYIKQFDAIVHGTNETDAWDGVYSFLRSLNLTQADYDAALAQVQTDENSHLDLNYLLDQIAGELTYLDNQIATYGTTIPTIDTMTTAQVRAVVKILAQTVQRLLMEEKAELRAWKYVIMRTK